MISSDFKKGFAIGLGVMGAVIVVGFAAGLLKKV